MRALEALYDQHGSLVYALCVRLLRDPAEAEEVTQEAFWYVWTHSERFDPERGSARSFLVQIARSRGLDRLRRQRRRLHLLRGQDELAVNEPAGSRATTPLQSAVSAQAQTRVRAALAGLPENQRRVVMLSFFDGLTHSEIADQLGVPLGTVKTRIRRGLLALREPLAQLRDEEVRR